MDVPTHKGATVRKKGFCQVPGSKFYYTWRVPAKNARALELRRQREADSLRRSMIPGREELNSLPSKDIAALCRNRGLKAGKSRAQKLDWRMKETKILALLRLRRQLPHKGATVPSHVHSPRDSKGRLKRGAETTHLPLTLTGKPFEVMVSGEKREEFRKKGSFIVKRLMHADGSPKLYDYVEFTNGYGKHRPRFNARYLGFSVKPSVNRKYSNGLIVKTRKTTYVLHLGRVLKKANMHMWFGPNGKSRKVQKKTKGRR